MWERVWNAIYIAIDGMLYYFGVLYDALELGDIVMPLVFITIVFSMFIIPIVLKNKLPSLGRRKGD